MRLLDLESWNENTYGPKELYEVWKHGRQEEPENHRETFSAEFLEILLATINGRNDFEIIGMTHKEIGHIIDKLMRKEGIIK